MPALIQLTRAVRRPPEIPTPWPRRPYRLGILAQLTLAVAGLAARLRAPSR